MAEGLTVRRREPLLTRLPVISHYRKSMGLQRGMLVAGMVLSGIFLLTAALAPVLSPYGFAERFDTQQPPSFAHLWGTTSGGYDVLSRVIWGTQTLSLIHI